MKKRYFVKFVPWNQNTISAMFSKKVWCSNVMDFNDFNELKSVHRWINAEYPKQYSLGEPFNANEELAKYFDSADNLYKMLHAIKMMRSFRDEKDIEWRDELFDIIMTKSWEKLFEEPLSYGVLLDLILYDRLGVFSMSHIEIFNDATAMVMFAHYADNLSGLALIFEDEKRLAKKVVYENIQNATMSHLYAFEKKLFEQPFLSKYKAWSSEQEYRIFTEGTGLKEMTDLNLKLVGILHTDRFKDLELLNHIKAQYSSQVFIEYVTPHSRASEAEITEPIFGIGAKKQLLSDYLHELEKRKQ